MFEDPLVSSRMHGWIRLAYNCHPAVSIAATRVGEERFSSSIGGVVVVLLLAPTGRWNVSPFMIFHRRFFTFPKAFQTVMGMKQRHFLAREGKQGRQANVARKNAIIRPPGDDRSDDEHAGLYKKQVLIFDARVKHLPVFNHVVSSRLVLQMDVAHPANFVIAHLMGLVRPECEWL